jgi:hypothetical protein
MQMRYLTELKCDLIRIKHVYIFMIVSKFFG